MKKLFEPACLAIGLMCGATIFATPSLAQQTGGQAQTTPPQVTQGAPLQVTQAAPPQPATCASLHDFITTTCPLTWYGITAYGTIDMGGSWQSHGVQGDTKSTVNNEFLISKNSNGPQWNRTAGALSQSTLGIRGDEPLPFAPDWDFIFKLEAGFNPWSFKFSDGPGSVAQNAGVPLNQQNTNADSSRGGQWYNSQGYFGVSSPTYGTLTVFRQYSLTLDGVIAYDPLTASNAFSPIGYQGTTCGVGDTEDCRFSTSLKYRVNLGPVRASALWQFGGYNLNNASDGAWQGGLGGDIHDVAGGTVSVDGIYSWVKDAVGVALAGNTLPAQLPQVLTATISNDQSWMALGRYEKGPVKLFAGYEWIQFAPPSNPQTSFTDISGNPLCLGCSSLNNTNIANTTFNFQDKVQQIGWVGAKYAVSDEWTVMGGYYQYWQNSFGSGATCSNSSKSTCAGTLKAVSFVADWQFSARFDAYAGAMWSTVEGGFANGYLHRHEIDPSAGFRFRF